MIFRIDVRGPWCVLTRPSPRMFAPVLPRGADTIIAFHIVVEGECWLRAHSGDWMALGAGEAVVLAHGDAHEIGDRPGRPAVPFDAVLSGRSLLDLRREYFTTGEAPSSAVVCGFLGCDRRAFEPLCAALPASFRVDLGKQAGELVRYASAKAVEEAPGAGGLRARMAELLFMEALRAHMQSLPPDATGWLAGLRDPLVGRALRALHGAPERDWSVEKLAERAAGSRSNLSARFREVMGEPPMQYLTRVRMQLAARCLAERSCTVDEVAGRVGYESSAAFQRAFKRCFGMPPAAWRRHTVTGLAR